MQWDHMHLSDVADGELAMHPQVEALRSVRAGGRYEDPAVAAYARAAMSVEALRNKRSTG